MPQSPAKNPENPCQTISFDDSSFTVCTFDLTSADLRLFLEGEGRSLFGLPVHGYFSKLDSHLKQRGLQLRFAMNAGMYHRNRDAVGLYVENGDQRKPLILNDGPGNFHLLPNGVFYWDDGGAGVMESKAYEKAKLSPKFATQSGPMLVIDGKLHARFIPGGSSRKMRNGVGVKDRGKTVIFAITDRPTNFDTFGRLFRDELKTPNALFLDGGRATQMFSRDLNRDDKSERMGPIVAIVEPYSTDSVLPKSNDQASDRESSNSSDE